MPMISKNDCCADRSILALLSAHQECLVTLKIDDVTSGAKSMAINDAHVRRW